jgi:hypothetical protein
MAEPKILTARELAAKAGISPAALRKLLRHEFNRAGKITVEGNRSEYRFNPSDPVTKQIIARAKKLKEEALQAKTPEPENEPKEDGKDGN